MKKGIDYVGVTVTFICHDGSGNFLMQLRGKNCRDEQGTWDVGGGGLELHDTVEHTLLKEIKEEYSVLCGETQFLGYRDMHRIDNGVPTHWVALDHLVHVDREKVKNGEPHKFDDIGWFTLDTLPTQLHSGAKAMLERYNELLRTKALL